MIVKSEKYEIENGNTNSSALAIIPRYSGEQFDNFYKNLDVKAKVLIYIDEKLLKDPGDSTNYLYSNLDNDPYFEVSVSTRADAELAEHADVVIPRFNPPINEDFFDELERYDDGTRLFINPPESQRYFSDKRYLEDIANSHPEIIPRTIVSDDPEELGWFMYDLRRNGQKEVVYKPARSFGGKNIGKISLDHNYRDLIRKADELLNGQEIVLQEFIRNVTQYGDKRIHVVNGEPIGALLRMPERGGFISNGGQGGSKLKTNITDITDSEFDILEKVLPLLKEKGVYWAGVDLIKNSPSEVYLGEINAVSPGLLYYTDELNRNLHGKSKEDSAVNYLVNEIKESTKKLNYNRVFSAS